MGVGLAQGAYDLAGHARDRQQFGKPIGSFQAVQFGLPTWRPRSRPGASWSTRRLRGEGSGRDFRRDAAMAKLYTAACRTGSSTGRRAARRLRLHGRVRDLALYRDQKILEIGEGTNEVQRMVIARLLGF